MNIFYIMNTFYIMNLFPPITELTNFQTIVCSLRALKHTEVNMVSTHLNTTWGAQT